MSESGGLERGRAGADRSPSAGFDFLHGRWDVRHVKLVERLAGCARWREFPGTLEVAPILSGLGNFDRNQLDDPAGAYEAHSLRLFRPATGEWTIHWLDGRFPGAGLGPPVVGRFEGGKAILFGADAHEGEPIEVRTTYEPLGEGRAEWTQAFRSDRHPDWEVNWVMHFTRTPE